MYPKLSEIKFQKNKTKKLYLGENAVLTGAVLVISVPGDSSHEADGRQHRNHPLKTVEGTSILTKGPTPGGESQMWQTAASMFSVSVHEDVRWEHSFQSG